MNKVKAYGHSELDVSLYHLMSALFFLEETKRLERQYIEQKIKPVLEKAHRACVIGGLMVIVASLEATINELLLDAYFVHEDRQKPLADMLNKWKKKETGAITDIVRNKKGSVLQKYQDACMALSAQPFDVEKEPYKGLEKFIELRNQLMHYKPEWGGGQRNIHDSLKSALKNKFLLNPFSKSGLFFPTKCLSHGCIQWGFDQCESFIREFYEKIGKPEKYIFREIQINAMNNRHQSSL